MAESMNVIQAARVFPVVLAETVEPFRVVRELAAGFAESKATVVVWDHLRGVQPFPTWDCTTRAGDRASGLSDAVNYLNQQMAEQESLKKAGRAKEIKPAVLLAINPHLLWGNRQATAAIVQSILDSIRAWSGALCRFVAIVPPGATYPEEWARYVKVVSYPLPNIELLAATIRDNLKEHKLPKSDDEVLRLAHAAQGLTLFEVGSACAVSITLYKDILVDVLAEQKAQMIRQTAGVEWVRSEFTFASLVGLGFLKDHMLRTARKPHSKGVLLVGPPGTGKTTVAYALGNELGLPVLQINMEEIKGGIVGESQRNLRRALDVAEAFGECIVVFDEIEKGMAGFGAGPVIDGGGAVAQQVGSMLMKWLIDRPQGIYTVATCNDFSALPGALIRAGRWDSIVLIGLPTPEQRDAIATLYAARYEVALEPRPDADGWTGAEIESAYRLAYLRDEPDTTTSSRMVVPWIRVKRNEAEALYAWAAGVAVPAEGPEETMSLETVLRDDVRAIAQF